MQATRSDPNTVDRLAELLPPAGDPRLHADFLQLCGFGGRLAGTPGELMAQDWALERLRDIGPGVRRVEVPYDGWTCRTGRLELLGDGGEAPRELRCQALLRSMSTPAEGLIGDVVDLGLGRPEDFRSAGDGLRGRIALVRHEYPFSPNHLHRRRKYDMAVGAGAAGFLIANPLEGAGPLSGSSGRPVDGAGIPAAYIGHADCAALVAAGRGMARVRLTIAGEERRGARAGLAMLDLPGGDSGLRIVISAHLDGHDTGVSALDNASGVAVALAAARALAPRMRAARHGLRVCLFSAEEWALAGSARHLADMDAAERATLALNINLDTVGGDDHLTAMISDFPALAGFVADAGRLSGIAVGTYLPLMPNSDHANFAAHGIPALRLTAGFDRPASRVRHILSAEDQPGIVLEQELQQALRLTVAMAWQGLTSHPDALRNLRPRTGAATA